MACPPPLACSMYADGALPPTETAALEAHLDACARCRSLVADFRQERNALATALRASDEAIAVPAFRPPLGPGALLIFGACAAGAAWLVRALWAGLAEPVLPAALAWINPFDQRLVIEALIGFTLYLVNEDLAMIASTLQSVSIAALAATLAAVLFYAMRSRGSTAALLSVLLLVAAAVLPPTGHALEIRRSEQLTTVAAGETIDDTLIILGESVTVDGDVNGDVIALARRVIVRGTVGGDLVTGAESVTIEGDVNGNVLGFARTLELQQSRIGRNLYGFAQQVSAGADTQIDGNAAVFAEGAVVRGLVGIDLLSFARTLELGGSVNRDLNAFGERVTLLERARVGRNLTARLANADNLQTASGAVVGGAIDIRADEPPEEQRSRYLTAGFYLWRAAWLGAAFLTGLVALWAFPALRSASLGTGAGVLMTGGIGLVTAVVLPVLAVIACITIIGLPVGIVAFLAWLAGLYLAKIVFANVLGSLLFRSPAGLPHYAATLLAGLVVVMIAINLPFVGWLFNIVLTLIGLGMIVEPIWNRTARRGAMG